MAEFDALREGFRELNRMLTDRQQWDEQHKKNTADAQFRNVMLKNNLEQQAFGRRMQEAGLGLRRMGAHLDAQKFENSVAQQIVVNKHNADSLAAQIRHQKATERTSSISANAAASRAEQFAKTSKIDRDKKELELKDLAYTNETIPLDFTGTVEANAFQDPVFREEVNKKAILDGFQVDESGVSRLKDGSVFMAPRKHQQAFHMWVGAIAEKHEDIEGKASGILNQLAEQITVLEDQKKDINTDGGLGPVVAAQIKREQNKIVGQMKQVGQLLTPEGKQQTLLMKASRLDQRARKLDEHGAYEAAKGLRSTADEYRDLVIAQSKDKTARLKATAGTPAAQRLADAAYDFGLSELTKDYSQKDTLLPKFQDQQAAQTFARNLYVRLASELGAPVGKKGGGELRKKVLEVHKQMHNNYHQLYLSAKTDNSLKLWKEEVMSKLGYLPTKPFENQIYRLSTAVKKSTK